MSQIQTLKQRQDDLKHKLTKAMPQITAALPKHLNGERMFRVYLTAVNSSPLILECEPISIIGAVMRAAAFGLSLETVTGEAFIIPRRNNKMGGIQVANFQIGYKGVRKLAMQGDPDLVDMFAYPVYEQDVFEYTLGMRPEIKIHKPAPAGSRGQLAYAYAVAVWKSDYRRFRVIDSDDIKLSKARAGGLQKPDSPWNTNPGAMWMKTAMLRLGNQLVLSSDVAKQIERDSTDGYEALRERAQEDLSTRGLLVDIGGIELLAQHEQTMNEPEATEQEPAAASGLDKVAAEAEREMQAPRPQRQRRARATTDVAATTPLATTASQPDAASREPGEEG